MSSLSSKLFASVELNAETIAVSVAITDIHP